MQITKIQMAMHVLYILCVAPGIKADLKFPVAEGFKLFLYKKAT